MNGILHRAATLVALFSVACSTPRGVLGITTPLAEARLGDGHRSIDAVSKEAQAWFDRGLTLDHAFNHDEAIACFQHAREVDPTNPMPWWGIALASGPHINNTAMSPEQCAMAWTNLEGALERKARANAANRALIEALAARYAATPPSDRRGLDEAYASAMSTVHARFTSDVDVTHLYAEALMDLQPWDLWTIEGAPKGRTLEIVALLEDGIARAPRHAGLNHLYVHAMEASREPAKAKPSADLLRTLAPDAGHLVHMPAHIDVRLGDYQLACEANERAIEADQRAAARTPRAGFYRIYMAHNAHFLSFASMLEGRSEAALKSARSMVAGFPAEIVEAAAGLVDGLMPVVIHALVRFGRWQEILDAPAFQDTLIIANSVRRYARGVAQNALGRVDEARAELLELKRLVGTLDDRPLGNNSSKVVMQIPVLILEGEIAFKAGDRTLGLERLHEAVAIEDTLVYDEPPDWMMPVRHPYGAMLLEAGEWKTAESCFRQDLLRFPANGWSLFGLARALRGQQRESDADDVEKQLAKAWSRADVKLHAPCFCQPGSGPGVRTMR